MRTVCLVIFVLIALNLEIAAGQEAEGRVLIDSYHVISSDAFMNKVESLFDFLQDNGYRPSIKNDPLAYPVLRNYSLLVIIAPTSPLSAGEVADMLKFLEEGGGLLLIGEEKNFTYAAGNTSIPYKTEYLNTLSQKVGITFNKDILLEKKGSESKKEFAINSFENHTLALGLSEIKIYGASSLSLSGKAKRIAYGSENSYSEIYDVVSYPPVIAASNYAYGRVVAVTDSEGYFNFDLPQVQKFYYNALSWLNVKPRLGKANEHLLNGSKSLKAFEYDAARRSLSAALGLFTGLEIEEKMLETRGLLLKSEEGLTALAAMNNAYSSYQDKKYTEARLKFEEAKGLFLGLDDKSRAKEAQDRVTELDKYLSGVTLFDEGSEAFKAGEYQKALDSFLKAQRAFSEFKDFVSAGKAEEMAAKSEKGAKALGLLREGDELMKSRDFARAREAFLRGKDIFIELGNNAGEMEIQNLIDRAERYIAAFSKYDEGEISFSKGEYEKAQNLFSQSASLFKELNDEAMARNAEEKAAKSSEELKEKTARTTALAAGVMVVAVCAGIFYWWKTRGEAVLERGPREGYNKSGKVRAVELALKKLEMRYTQGGVAKKEYVKMRRELERELELEKKRVKNGGG